MLSFLLPNINPSVPVPSCVFPLLTQNKHGNTHICSLVCLGAAGNDGWCETWAWGGSIQHVGWRPPRLVASLPCNQICSLTSTPVCLCPPARSPSLHKTTRQHTYMQFPSAVFTEIAPLWRADPDAQACALHRSGAPTKSACICAPYSSPTESVRFSASSLCGWMEVGCSRKVVRR
jgi:hypothetical protein